MKTEIPNLLEISESDLLRDFYQVKPKRGEFFKENDLVLINKYGKTLTCAKITKASYLIRKHLDITDNPPVYRKD